MGETPTFSVIMPVCHGGQLLREALGCLRGLDFAAKEMEVLVSGREEDEDSRRTVEAERAIAGFVMRYVGSNSGRRAVVLNAACAEAQGKYLAFLDDDVFAERDWLVRLLEVLKSDADVGIVGGVDELVGELGSFDLALDSIPAGKTIK